MSLTAQDAILLERAIDPNSDEYRNLMQMLLDVQDDGRTRAQRLKSGSEFRYVLPYKGDPDVEDAVTVATSLQFSDKAYYRNGVASLALTAHELVDLMVMSGNSKRMSSTLVASAEASSLYDVLRSSGSVSTVLYFSDRDNLASHCASLSSSLETLIIDHTTINLPIDEVLNMAYKAGIKIVDGVFPYHVAATRGWDVVAGLGKWSYTHQRAGLSVGPDDDSTRLMFYERGQYNKFVDPKLWHGNSRKYVFEIRRVRNGLATYRAVYGGGVEPDRIEDLSYKLPTCSSEDMVLITLNKQLAAGAFVSRSNNARELAELDKNYAIEVRKDLFESTVAFLVSDVKGSDIVGNAIRYITTHNYVDLVEGVRIVRCAALSYADALCVAMVCALVAYDLKYKLTSSSLPIINKSQTVAKMLHHAPLGALGRLTWLMATYVSEAFKDVAVRSTRKVLEVLHGSDFIPGICYDVYIDMHYTPKEDWYEAQQLVVKPDRRQLYDTYERDAFAVFTADTVEAYAPSVIVEKTKSVAASLLSVPPYVPKPVADPVAVLQDAYDQAFPGNSTAQLQNVAELRRIRDVNVNTEFHGKIMINKDIAAPERLYADAPLRTTMLPVSRTPLLDAILASAKRNFNPPDIQMQSDVYEFSKYLVDEFISNCFLPNYKETIGKAYKANPISFNLTDYIEWLALKDPAYRTALEAECPEDIVELSLEKYDTIIKKRVKPKLSTTAQFELAQPQVIVSLSKKDTAPFTSLFRQIFERFDSALRPEYKSAGRLSDDQISEWLTTFLPLLTTLPAVEIDSGKYDKSQGLLARLVESTMFVELGLDPNVMDIFADSHVGKVSSKVLGLMFISAYQMKSGAPQTMLGNLIYNFISAGHSIGYINIAAMIAKGDDNVIWLRHSVDPKLATSKMSKKFNLETKYISDSVICFSSGYFVFLVDEAYFAPDPMKAVELLGERTSGDTLYEKFVSFGDRVRSYTRHSGLPQALQALVRHRLSVPTLDVVSVVDALLAVAGNFDSYKNLVPLL